MGEASLFEPIADYSRGTLRGVVAKICGSWALLVGASELPVWTYRIYCEKSKHGTYAWVFASEDAAHGAAMRWQNRGR